MKLTKRLTAMFAALLILLLSVGSVSAAPTTSPKLVPVLTKISRDVLIPALPFVSSNSGLMMLEDALAKQQSGADAGILGSVIVKALQYTDAQTLQRGIDSLYAFDEDFRRACQSIYQNCESINLSATEQQGVAALVNLLEQDEPGLQAALGSHQISEGMIANFLSAFVTHQGGSGIFGLDTDGNFLIQKYPVALASSLDAIWQGEDDFLDIREYLDTTVVKLNTQLSGNERSSVASLLRRVGLLSSSGETPSVDGGGGSEKEVETLPEKQIGAFKEIAKPAEHSDAVFAFEVLQDGVISIPGTFAQPVVYQLKGVKTEVVTMALFLEDEIVAELSKGQYIVKETTPYFADCNGWAQPYVEALYARGIIGGKAEQLFMPEDWITREEFVKLVVELFDMVDETATTSFADVPAEAWYYAYVASAQQYGIVSGVSETEFGVGQLIRRQDMAKIICDVLQKKGLTLPSANDSVFADFSFVSDYARSQVLSAHALGIISGDEQGNFNPRDYAKRGESAKMIYGMLRVVLERAE